MVDGFEFGGGTPQCKRSWLTWYTLIYMGTTSLVKFASNLIVCTQPFFVQDGNIKKNVVPQCWDHVQESTLSWFFVFFCFFNILLHTRLMEKNISLAVTTCPTVCLASLNVLINDCTRNTAAHLWNKGPRGVGSHVNNMVMMMKLVAYCPWTTEQFRIQSWLCLFSTAGASVDKTYKITLMKTAKSSHRHCNCV